MPIACFVTAVSRRILYEGCAAAIRCGCFALRFVWQRVLPVLFTVVCHLMQQADARLLHICLFVALHVIDAILRL